MMRRQSSRVTASSMTDQRIDSAPFTGRAVKNALSSVWRLCGRLRRQVVRRDDKIERQNLVNEMGGKLAATKMQLDNEELWNLITENVENELRQLAMQIKRCCNDD